METYSGKWTAVEWQSKETVILLTQNSSEDPVQFVIIVTTGKNQGGNGTMKRDIGRELLESIEAVKKWQRKTGDRQSVDRCEHHNSG